MNNIEPGSNADDLLDELRTTLNDAGISAARSESEFLSIGDRILTEVVASRGRPNWRTISATAAMVAVLAAIVPAAAVLWQRPAYGPVQVGQATELPRSIEMTAASESTITRTVRTLRGKADVIALVTMTSDTRAVVVQGIKGPHLSGDVITLREALADGDRERVLFLSGNHVLADFVRSSSHGFFIGTVPGSGVGQVATLDELRKA